MMRLVCLDVRLAGGTRISRLLHEIWTVSSIVEFGFRLGVGAG